jgi:hypothetical protein
VLTVASGTYVLAPPAGLRVVTYPLTASQLNDISNDVSVEIITAPGVGKVLIPVRAFGVYRAGAHPYGVSGSQTLLIGWEVLEDATSYALFMFKKLTASDIWGGGADFGASDQFVIFGGSDAALGDFGGTVGGFLLEWFENQPISVCWKGVSFAIPGAITASTLVNSSPNYAVGDTGTVNGGTGATYVIDAVDDSPAGSVTAYTLTAPGANYAVGSRGTTVGGAQPGVGTVFNIHVDSTDESGDPGDGTLDLTVHYVVVDV